MWGSISTECAGVMGRFPDGIYPRFYVASSIDTSVTTILFTFRTCVFHINDKFYSPAKFNAVFSSQTVSCCEGLLCYSGKETAVDESRKETADGVARGTTPARR